MPISTQHDEQPQLNMTPMIDIVFLIIIFFMVGTKFTELERKIGLQVPEVSEVAAMTPAPEKRVVNVYRDGQITLDRQQVSILELVSRLTAARSQYRDLGVLIRGDAESSFQQVADVLAACKRAGVGELGISVRIASRER